MASNILSMMILGVFCSLASAVLNLRGPAIASNFPDPSFIHVNGTYYAFATANGNPANINVQLARSNDYRRWSLIPGYDVMPMLPKWAAHPKAAVWAPDVKQLVG